MKMASEPRRSGSNIDSRDFRKSNRGAFEACADSGSANGRNGMCEENQAICVDVLRTTSEEHVCSPGWKPAPADVRENLSAL